MKRIFLFLILLFPIFCFGQSVGFTLYGGSDSTRVSILDIDRIAQPDGITRIFTNHGNYNANESIYPLTKRGGFVLVEVTAGDTLAFPYWRLERIWNDGVGSIVDLKSPDQRYFPINIDTSLLKNLYWNHVDTANYAKVAHDPDAIHDNVAQEINPITLKASPTGADILLIEDAAAGYIKKKIQISALTPTPTPTDLQYFVATKDVTQATTGTFASITDWVEDANTGPFAFNANTGALAFTSAAPFLIMVDIGGEYTGAKSAAINYRVSEDLGSGFVNNNSLEWDSGLLVDSINHNAGFVRYYNPGDSIKIEVRHDSPAGAIDIIKDAARIYAVQLIDGTASLALNNLSDVNTGTPGPSEDGWVLQWDDGAGEYNLVDATTFGLQNVVEDITPELGGTLDALSEDIINVNNLTFDITPTTPATTEGSLYWDASNYTLAIHNDEGDVTMQTGQENWIRVRNESGVTINNGQVVYMSGSEVAGEFRPLIGLAQADDESTAQVIGVATHDIENNTYGYVTSFGIVNDLNTSAYTEGDHIYLSSTVAGDFTATKPTTPNYAESIGHINRVHASLGSVLVQVTPDTGDPSGDASEIVIQAIKGSVGTINPGDVVYQSGWNAGLALIEIELADSDNTAAMPAIGIARSTITNVVSGDIVFSGKITGLNTSAFSDGDPLFVDVTPGAYTSTRPTGAALEVQKIGSVLRSNVTNGVIQVVGAGRSNDIPNYFNDSYTRFADDGDPTKLMQMQLSAITTATTRTWTVPDRDLDFSVAGTFAEYSHGATHITGGASEVDGDQLDIDWNPVNYTPATTPAEVSDLDHLTSHLYGIDQAIAGAGENIITDDLTQVADRAQALGDFNQIWTGIDTLQFTSNTGNAEILMSNPQSKVSIYGGANEWIDVQNNLGLIFNHGSGAGSWVTIRGPGSVATGRYRINDLDNTNWIGFRSPDVISSNFTLEWPDALPAGSYLLQSTSGGIMSWVDPATISSSPGGADTELQYNDGGVFGGTSVFTYNDATNLLTYSPLLDEATGDEQGLTISGTVNKATSGNYRLLDLDMTETAAPGTDDRLLNMSVGGVDQAWFTNTGNLFIGDATGSPEIRIDKDETGVGAVNFYKEGADQNVYIRSNDFERLEYGSLVHEFEIGGTIKWDISGTQLRSVDNTGGRLAQIGSSLTASYLSRNNDTNSGVGGDGSDNTALIANSKTALVTSNAGTAVNVELFGSVADFGGTISGEGVLRIGDVTTVPTGVLASGGLLYVSGTGLHFLDDAGTDTDLTAAAGGVGGSDTEILFNNASTEDGIASLTYAVATDLLTFAPTIDEATGDEQGLTINATINKATSGNYRLLDLNATETSAPGTDDRLINMSVGGVDQAWFTNAGDLFIGDATGSPEIRIDHDAAGSGKFAFYDEGVASSYVQEDASQNLYLETTGVVGYLSRNAGLQFRWNSSKLGGAVSGGGDLVASGASLTAPWTHRTGDPNSGLGGDGSDGTSLISNAKAALVTSDAGTATNIEMFGSGGSFGATIAGQGVLRLNAVTTTPTGLVSGGGLVYVTGNDIRYLAADGTDATMIAAGGGDVTKVGTPVDSQIGVWTGDGTIEGDAAWTFDTSTDLVTLGDATSSPEIRIDHDDAGTGRFSFYDEGVASSYIQNSSTGVLLVNSVAIGSLGTAGAARFSWDSNAFYANSTAGGSLARASSSLTSPFTSRQNDTNSGLGGDGSDNTALISNAKSALVTSDAGTATNVELFGSAALFGATTPGQGVLRFNDVTQAPAGTMTSGGLLYVSGTSLNFMDDGGTITDLTAGAGAVGGSDTEILFNNSSTEDGIASLTYAVATDLLTFAPTIDEATGDEQGLTINATINKATSGNYRLLDLNATETSAPGTDDRLINMSVGGTDVAYFDNAGNLQLNPTGATGSQGVYFDTNNYIAQVSGTQVRVFLGGVAKFEVASSLIGTTSGGGGSLSFNGASLTSPFVLPRSDTNSGVGSDASDGISLISNAKAALVTSDAGAATNVELFGSVADFGGTISGEGVLRIGDVTTVPTGVLASGGLLYVSGTGLHFLDDAGTDTDLTATAGGVGGSDTEILFNNASTEDGIASLTYAVATDLLTYAPTVDEATGNEIAFTLNSTINKATSGNYTLLDLNAVETSAPGTDDRLLNMSVGGVDQAWFTNTGDLFIGDATGSPEIRIDHDAAGSGTLSFYDESVASSSITNDASGNLLIDAKVDGLLRFSGSTKFYWNTSLFGAWVTTGGRIAANSSSLIVPYVFRGSDPNSGLGGDGSDNTALISNAKSALVTSDAGTATNVELFGSAALIGATTPGQGVLRFNDVTQAPAGTMTSGGLLWVSTTSLNFMDDAGTITDLTAPTDADAIHDNVNGEIVAIAEKTTLTTLDEVIIEDQAASNAKKSAKISAVRGEHSKTITIESPTSTEDISMFFTNQAITVTEMRAVLNNGTATPSVTWTIRHATDRSAAGAEVVTGGTATTSVTTGSDVTSFNDATIVADSFVWFATTAQSGTVPELTVTIFYTQD
jgi:hypothetical protein